MSNGMSLAIYPSTPTSAVLGSEVGMLADVTEERVETVLNLMKMARFAALSLFKDLGLQKGEAVVIGQYTIQGQDFCAIPIRALEQVA